MPLSKKILNKLIEKKISVSTAESCTGGLLAYSFVKNKDSSKVYKGGYITYSNEMKIKELKVKKVSLNKNGAVSYQVAEEMIEGLFKKNKTKLCLSTTGIAGPGNDGTSKKIGYVYVGIASKTWAIAEATQIGGNRQENKEGFVHFALLTAIRHWDQAMELAETNRLKDLEQREAKAREDALAEIERNKRAAAAAQETAWQSQTWSGENPNVEGKGMGIDVHWDDESLED